MATSSPLKPQSHIPTAIVEGQDQTSGKPHDPMDDLRGGTGSLPFPRLPSDLGRAVSVRPLDWKRWGAEPDQRVVEFERGTAV